jgi:ion channel-forming bestrophin family protein
MSQSGTTMIIKPFFTEFNFTLALRKVFYVSLVVGVYTLFPYWVHQQGLLPNLDTISSGLEAFLGLVLSLLLVFRANRAYERWWEARSQWGILVNVSRNLAIKIHTFIDPSEQQAHQFANLIGQFGFYLLHHLRKTTYESNPLAIPAKIEHKPGYITTLLYEKLETYKKEGTINDVQFLMIDTDLSRFMHVTGACEKIKNTLISLSYRSFVHHIMIILFLFLPWKLADSYGLWSIPLAVMIAYITFALEGIARNLEEPFGVSHDDVHMEEITTTIDKSIKQVLITQAHDKTA